MSSRPMHTGITRFDVFFIAVICAGVWFTKVFVDVYLKPVANLHERQQEQVSVEQRLDKLENQLQDLTIVIATHLPENIDAPDRSN